MNLVNSPASKPLTVAMASVPPQTWEPPYDPSQGLSQGTIFPSLNQPFFATEQTLGGGHHD